MMAPGPTVVTRMPGNSDVDDAAAGADRAIASRIWLRPSGVVRVKLSPTKPLDPWGAKP